MSNQWGRETQGAQGRSAGFAGILVAIVISLLIGASGGYLYLRFTQPDQSAALEQGRQQVASLKQQLEQAVRRADDAGKALDAARAAQPSTNPDTAALNDRIAALRTELDTMVQALSTASLKQRQAVEAADSLSQEFAAERSALQDRVRELEDSATASDRQRQTLDQQLAAARLAVTTAQAGDSDALAGLKAQVATLEAELAALRKDRAKVATDLDAALRDLVSARSELTTVQGRMAEQTQQLTALEAQLATARSDAARAAEKAAPPEPQPVPALPTVPAPTPPPEPTAPPLSIEPERQARDAVRVDQVMATAPGLDRLTPVDFQRLRALLLSGQCVTTGLEAVFTRVPVITLRNLIRDLNSDC
ncbi:MAG: hypothetical protein ACOH2J_19835 [Allorhizobium sp.]